MAICNAVKSGNWSDPTVWDVVPQSGDTVRCGNYVVTIDVDVDIGTGTLQRNGSGQFRVTAAPRTITASAQSVPGSSTDYSGALRLQHSTGLVTLNGDALGSNVSNAAGVSLESSGQLIINGSAIGGSAGAARGVCVSGTGTLTVTNATGGSAGGAYGVYVNANATVYVTNATGGSVGNAHGVYVNANATVYVTKATGGSVSDAHGVYVRLNATVYVTNATGGSVYGAYGVYVTAACTLNVTNATGGSAGGAHSVYVNAACNATVQTATGGLGGYGVYAAANGCTVYDAYPNAFGNGSVTTYGAGVGSAHNAYVKVRRAHCNQYGAWPIAGRAYVDETIYPSYTVQVYDKDGQSHTMIEPNGSADYPAPADVRYGVAYDNGDFVGTCHVPLPEQVAYGVPVDDTVGTAVLTQSTTENAVWDAPRAAHTTPGTFGDVSEWSGVGGGAVAGSGDNCTETPPGAVIRTPL